MGRGGFLTPFRGISLARLKVAQLGAPSVVKRLQTKFHKAKHHPEKHQNHAKDPKAQKHEK